MNPIPMLQSSASAACLLVAFMAAATAADEPRRPTLQIINGTHKPVEVFWLQDDATRVPQGSVAPGDDTMITTTLGHRFAIVPAGGKDESIVTSEVPIQAHRVGGVPAFFTQRIEVNGFPIIASERVNPYALKEAAYLVGLMLANRPDIGEALVKSGARMNLLAWNEFTTDHPEFKRIATKPAPGFPGMSGKDYWDARARGTGGSATDPYCSCGEENLLAYPGDPYADECILIHEFAHMIHLRGMNNLDPTFDARVKAAYADAMAKGLWKDKYPSVNHHEYFAEGVQTWFDNNRVNDHDHNHVHLRSQLEEYDPGLAALCREVFGDTTLKYTKPTTRLTGHLAGYDPSQAPTFVWPHRLAEAKKLIGEKARARGADKPPEKKLILPGDVFSVDGRTAFVFSPSADAAVPENEKPWIIYTPTLPGYPDKAEQWMHEQFTKAGVAVAGIDTGESYGSPTAVQATEALHAEMVKRGYSKKPALFGRSRGGLGASAWAIAHPEFTAGIGGIYPVYDWRSYPGLAKAAPAYGLSADELAAKAAELCPIERIEVAAKADVPVCIIHGDADALVPLEPNSAELVRRYQAAGKGDHVTLIVAKGQGHTMWEGFFRCQELVDFLIARAKGT
jgi:alpha-beta hydrolase superfamily lysophospholipase